MSPLKRLALWLDRRSRAAQAAERLADAVEDTFAASGWMRDGSGPAPIKSALREYRALTRRM